MKLRCGAGNESGFRRVGNARREIVARLCVRYDLSCQLLGLLEVVPTNVFARRLVTVDQSAIRARSRGSGHHIMVRPCRDRALPNSSYVVLG